MDLGYWRIGVVEKWTVPGTPTLHSSMHSNFNTVL
jgi:hypothetical protein